MQRYTRSSPDVIVVSMTFVVAHLALTGFLAVLLLAVITVQNAAQHVRRLRPSSWDGTERRSSLGTSWTGLDRRQPSLA